jgi:hypothetical protein
MDWIALHEILKGGMCAGLVYNGNISKFVTEERDLELSREAAARYAEELMSE